MRCKDSHTALPSNLLPPGFGLPPLGLLVEEMIDDNFVGSGVPDDTGLGGHCEVK